MMTGMKSKSETSMEIRRRTKKSKIFRTQISKLDYYQNRRNTSCPWQIYDTVPENTEQTITGMEIQSKIKTKMRKRSPEMKKHRVKTQNNTNSTRETTSEHN